MNRDTLDDPKQALIALITDEMQRIRAAMGEIKVQLDQTQNFVNREQQRNSDLAAELRTVQDNLETIPRQDIRAKYDEAMEARFRLTTMRGQLEKFQSNRDYLEQQQVYLSGLLSRVQGADIIPDVVDRGSGNGTPRTASSMNIIRIVQAQEDERQRLARQMHDGPAQSLTNFILQAEICQKLFDRNPDRAADELGNLKTTASVTFQKVRDFIFDLRPMMLDDLGVVPTVRRYVESFKEKNDIDATLEMMGEDRRLENHNEVLIFRGIQELMVLARDHAHPTRLTIKLDIGQTRAKASVEDNGRGFDVQMALAQPHGDGQAPDPRAQSIITMKEKFELVGGSLTVVSSETDGTIVRFELPVDED
jgi:two-component system sensor histidine kinase DegS